MTGPSSSSFETGHAKIYTEDSNTSTKTVIIHNYDPASSFASQQPVSSPVTLIDTSR